MSGASSYAALPVASAAAAPPLYAQYQQQQSQGIYPAMLAPLPQPPPSQQQQQQQSFAHTGLSVGGATGGASVPAFQFLRLKSFSPHTHALLRRLEAAIASAPHSPQAWLDLAEEYRVLGARSGFLRLLEHAKRLFPAEPSIRLMLYAHAPDRPRTPPAAEPAIQMERTATYDYKWRHREAANLFPTQLLKLDTSVPPYGRVLRAQHLAFLALAGREEPWESKEEKRARRAKVLAQMALEHGGDGADDATSAARPEVGKRGVAIVIPARFNGNTGTQAQAHHPVPLPFAAEPVPDAEEEQGAPGGRASAQRPLDTAAQRPQPQPPQPVSASSSGVASPVLAHASSLHVSTGSSGPASGASSSAASPGTGAGGGGVSARKLLSPSKSQVRRESMGSAAMGALLAEDTAAASRTPIAGSSSASPPQQPQPPPEQLSEDEMREQRERQWAEEEEAQAAEEAAEARARQRELQQLAAAREAHAHAMLQQQQAQAVQLKQQPV